MAIKRKNAIEVASRFYSGLKAQGMDGKDIRVVASRLYSIGKGKIKPTATAAEPATQTTLSSSVDKPQANSSIESPQTHYEKFVISEDVPKYYARRIGGQKDVAILTSAYEKRMNTLVIGETGTGKTHAVRTIAHANRAPYIRVNLDSMVTVEDLIGEYKPNGDGGFVWTDGVLTRFVRNGGIFVCDEINAAPAEVLFLLHGLLDDGRQIVLRQRDGEVIRAHKDFWFVATMNFNYEGTKPLNQALLDRFQVVLNFDYQGSVEKKLITNPKLLEFAGAVRKIYAQNQISSPCSTRLLLQYERNIEIFGFRVAKEILVNRFEQQDKKAVRETFEMIVPEPDTAHQTTEEDESDD